MVEGLRRQYHFMPDDDGMKAWDVHRLIELARDLPVSELEVATVAEIDTVHWFDGELERPTVRKVIEHVRIIEACDLSYPVILGADGRVMDGMHRIVKALLAGRATVPAVRFPVDPEICRDIGLVLDRDRVHGDPIRYLVADCRQLPLTSIHRYVFSPHKSAVIRRGSQPVLLRDVALRP